ncbi:uncharacterized protein spmap2l isoform X3 [Oreochromis niloticus]|uniref:uncharacterized protein spmap2l isoform X3 n=1 Tax=Oreochromis niloticus TaxID=8128 RepID=UPI000674B17C|nr:testicular haploid expressed gene protein-like isoform X3 [Oreochromis niloticus]
MVSGKQAVQSTFGPSQSEKLSWGNQEPVWPISASALGAAPSARIQYLSRHKRDFSAREDHRRKEEEATASLFRKTQRPSSKTSQYENTLRLSTPRTRTRSSQDAGLSPDPPVSGIPGPSQLRGRELLVLRRKNRDFEDSLRNTIVQGLMPPHTPQCEKNCPVWHTEPRVKSAVITPRLLQLSKPKLAHPDFQRSRESVASIVSLSSRKARISQRLVQLSLPRLKESNICCALGRPEESIWNVSRAARRATASARIEMLAEPKQLSKDYIPPRDPEWSRKNVQSI